MHSESDLICVYFLGVVISFISIYFYNKRITENKIELSLALKFSLLSFVFVSILFISVFMENFKKPIKEEMNEIYSKLNKIFLNN